jgi:hypothetical protein
MHLRKYLAVEQSPHSPIQRPIAEEDIQALDKKFGVNKERFYGEITSMLTASDVLQSQLAKEQIYRDAISDSLQKEAELVRV